MIKSCQRKKCYNSPKCWRCLILFFQEWQLLFKMVSKDIKKEESLNINSNTNMLGRLNMKNKNYVLLGFLIFFFCWFATNFTIYFIGLIMSFKETWFYSQSFFIKQVHFAVVSSLGGMAYYFLYNIRQWIKDNKQ